MIKMFYYNKDEFIKELIEHKICEYSERSFDRLMNWQYDKEGNSIQPFRDEDSKKFLKDTWNLEFIDEHDWYSIHSPEEGRFSLAGLSKGMKYGLTLLDYSKRGLILSFQHCSEKLWKVLNEMPFDILVAVDTSKLESWSDVMIGVDYIIENFPFEEKKLKVHVPSRYGRFQDYEELKDKKGMKIYYKDETYYVRTGDIENVFCRYFWKKHIKEIVDKVNCYIVEEYPILNKILETNLFDFWELIGEEKDELLSGNSYFWDISWANTMLNDGSISREEYETWIEQSKLKFKEEYEEYKKYSELIKELKIISHLYVLPKKIYQRKLPVMVVDKYANGVYKIWGTLTIKNPNFADLLYEAVFEYYTEDCERYITIVDVEELFSCAGDIEYTNCGFKISKNCIEIFDRNDAMKLFRDIAQEALDSGNCEISEEFY